MNTPEDKLKFFKEYSCIISTKSLNNEKQKLVRSCRFCGLSEPDATFNNTSHIIPEVLGSNKTYTYQECDKCNTRFSKYEKDLGHLFSPYLALIGVRGKSKVKAFQSRTDNYDKSSLTTIKVDATGTRYMNVGNENDIELDRVNNKGYINCRIPRHKPIYVYISLLKIALSMLPSTLLNDYKHVFEYINGNLKILLSPVAFMTVLTEKMFKEPYAEIYELNDLHNGISAKHTLVLRFANIIVQIFLPFPKDMENIIGHSGTVNAFLYPSFLLNNNFKEIDTFEDINYSYKKIDLSSSETTEYNHKIPISFSAVE